MSDNDSFLRMTKMIAQTTQLKQEEMKSAISDLQKRTIPTPPEVIRKIWNTAGAYRKKVMLNHVYWKEMKLKEGYEALVNTAHLAYVDICKHEAALISYHSNQNAFNKHIDYTVVNPFQKEVLAFCSASIGIVEITRRILKIRDDINNDMKELVTAHFNDNLPSFIKDLRNNLSHGSVIVPGWSISISSSGKTGLMILSADELLALGDWSSKGRSYIESFEDNKVSIKKAVEDYHCKIQHYHSSLSDLFARNITPEEKDYYDIEDELKRWSYKQQYKILATQIGKGKNPYLYLHKFFSKNEVRQILRFPNHSKEQVDYIISLKSVDIECDDYLRFSLYDIFGVDYTSH